MNENFGSEHNPVDETPKNYPAESHDGDQHYVDSTDSFTAGAVDYTEDKPLEHVPPAAPEETIQFERANNPYSVSTTNNPAPTGEASYQPSSPEHTAEIPEAATTAAASATEGYSPVSTPQSNVDTVSTPPANSYQGYQQSEQPVPPTQEYPYAAAAENLPSGGAPAPAKRSIGLLPATAIALVSALTASGITVAAVQGSSMLSQSQSQSNVVESLNSPVSDSSSREAPAGSVEAVAAKVLPSVVSIKVATRTSGSEGSGSIISEDGYIMTNNHVVAGAASGDARITATLNDGTTYEADFIAGDANTDVAVIKLRDASGLPAMSFGDSDNLAVGQEVVAVGSPLGLSATVTSGIVSALNRPVRASGTDTGQSSLIDAIQTDAAINPGNSGGPLVDMEGNQIGINSVIASTSTSSGEAGSIGLGFAIPANFARRVASQLIETGQATQPLIGIQLVSNSRVVGAEIAQVNEGGPGEQAGLVPGEVITRMNGRRIDSADALIAAVRSSDFGEVITLTVVNPETQETRNAEVTLTGAEQ
ncbi:Serine protease [Corynebacterium kutscheri]|uniref:Serine protease n=1 Tax=Corynebacterium kutscheri TaxID=35755 RepID=A0AB38VQ00_9CORY|nr:trypsin-like peptidase domain-containing protein [Corynebacterium kutscheri]VEH04327.1 Serine protease [Corynebacterium kutscheri]VEH80250.1 Serine protease [Corynebacterium kutscheri]